MVFLLFRDGFIWRLLAKSALANLSLNLAAALYCQARGLHGRLSDTVALLNFTLVALGSYVAGPASGHAARSFCLNWMLLSWAFRLVYFLLKRANTNTNTNGGGGGGGSNTHNRKTTLKKTDERIDGFIGGDWKRAMLWWTGQSVWVTAVSLPVLASNLSAQEDAQGFLGWRDRYGVMVWLSGWIAEAVADDQRFTFNQTPLSHRLTPFIASGLWKWSRHPNYFGEFLNWLGIWMVASPILCSTAAIVVCFLSSPLFTLLMLTKISGIPVSDSRDDRRFGRLPAYLQYKYVTSPFFPLPPSVYAQLDGGVRRFVLFETFQPRVRRVRRTLVSNSLASSPNR